ncbi:hypothetical protein BDV41DRAFT_521645 [Aspergillus transmontanensis]|uniref:Uncharacterized protein n=1 Tax=Aspergillus transmontanensis TaxID=1034304 RepID=A0A5N6WDA6_9EURO|nr:hypothetical protein BDV41DRAFT_521645 [Aspergillus transmontanensis]
MQRFIKILRLLLAFCLSLFFFVGPTISSVVLKHISSLAILSTLAFYILLTPGMQRNPCRYVGCHTTLNSVNLLYSRKVPHSFEMFSGVDQRNKGNIRCSIMLVSS